MLKNSTLATLFKILEQKISNVSEMLEYNQKQYDTLKGAEGLYQHDMTSGVATKTKVDARALAVHKEAIDKYEPLLKEYQDALDDLKQL